jgi:hypothetical protein
MILGQRKAQVFGGLLVALVLLYSEGLNAMVEVTQNSNGLGRPSPPPIKRPEGLAEQFDAAVTANDTVVKPIVRPVFDKSKYLKAIADAAAKILKPELRPKDMGKEIDTRSNVSIQSLLDKISYGEGATPQLLQKQGKNTSPYDMVYGYKQYLTPSTPVSSMTLKELFTFQNQLINKTKGTISGKTSTNKGTSAVGKYQILQSTLFGKNGTAENPGIGSWADVLNLNASDTFSPAVQEKIARLALKESGYNNYLDGKKSQAKFLEGIAIRWASVADLSGTNPSGQPTATSAQSLMPLIDNIKNNGQTISVNDLMIRK